MKKQTRSITRPTRIHSSLSCRWHEEGVRAAASAPHVYLSSLALTHAVEVILLPCGIGDVVAGIHAGTDVRACLLQALAEVLGTATLQATFYGQQSRHSGHQ